METALDRHIEANPAIRGGKPYITGTRITMSDVVLMHLRLGQGLEQIAGHYGISLAALHAAMAYYYDHQEEIDRRMDEEDAVIQASRDKCPSLLRARIKALKGE
jgi:uncharacterized protein (DUF433 family)